MEPFTRLTSRVVVLPVDNIDTDQIIPARFLKTTDRTGLGASLFADWRYLPDGQPDPTFVLNYPQSQGAQVLLVGDNFGCGSSREHAAWALLGWGFRAVISTSFADIFRNNALKNGLLPVAVPPEVHQELVRLLGRDPSQTVTIDLETQTLYWAGGETHFPVDPFAKDCLLRGVDELGYLLSLEREIAAFEAKRFSG
jgi:3-isopropylmalate/(R)-2-methylmalate dehydratase small subunit